ncbi:hypothetical protein [Paenibacillus caui]|nr:hypothetical protein [Paenibacillus caui]
MGTLAEKNAKDLFTIVITTILFYLIFVAPCQTDDDSGYDEDDD